MKALIHVLLGFGIAVIVMRIITARTDENLQSKKLVSKFKKFAKTPEFHNVLGTPELRKALLTPEFRDYAKEYSITELYSLLRYEQ